jgi:hypothetical protein
MAFLSSAQETISASPAGQALRSDTTQSTLFALLAALTL